MEFGSRQLTYAMALLATISAFGCAESSAYVDYSELPKAAVESLPIVDHENGDHDAAASTDEPSQANAATPKDADTEQSPAEDDPTLKPVQADYDATSPGKVSQAANEVINDPPAPLKIELLVPQKSFPSIKGTDAVRVGYDDIDLMKILNMDPVPVNAVEHFPEWLQQLDGQRIRIKGYMYPTFRSEGLKGFVLTRDTGECCFGPNAFVYFLIKVRLAAKEKTDYIHGKPFDVEGIFRIDPQADDSGLFQLYRIEDAKML